MLYVHTSKTESAEQHEADSARGYRRKVNSTFCFLEPSPTDAHALCLAGDPNARVLNEAVLSGTQNTTGIGGSLDEKLAFIHVKHTIIVVPPDSERDCRPQTYPCYITVCDKDHNLVGDKTFRVDRGEQICLMQSSAAIKAGAQ